MSARRTNGTWRVVLGDGSEVHSKVLVNTAGPWVSQVLGQVIGVNDPARIRMVKGSHLIVSKLYGHDRCYIFQNADGRICFAIPYEQDFTLIGTTDEDFHGDPANPHITETERDYLLAAVSEYFRKPVTRDMVRWSYSGIRPLYDDGASKAQEATRDYVLKLEGGPHEAPLLSVFGGKITTFRKLAEAALEKLSPFLPAMKQPWTATAKLPGGDFPFAEVEHRIADLDRRYSFLTPQNARRLFRAYGTRAEKLLSGARSAKDLGQSFGPLSEREIEYLIDQEFAGSAEDILWRRSKLGLHMSEDQQTALRKYLSTREISDGTKRVAAS
jgi:glycerol-3-phosphate dehydrogenase